MAGEAEEGGAEHHLSRRWRCKGRAVVISDLSGHKEGRSLKVDRWGHSSPFPPETVLQLLRGADSWKGACHYSFEKIF